jgi:membrane protein YqaA with SNARE-associated domain
MLRKLYNWMIAKAASPQAVPALGAVSFIESSIFPLPPDLMLIPMCLADRKRAFYFAFICTVTSVLGGLFGYAIGYFLFESVGKFILGLFGDPDKLYATFKTFYDEHGAWIILVKGMTPIPYKIVTIFSGMVQFSLPLFILTSIPARGVRFFLVAGLIYFFGEKIRDFLEKHLEAALMGVLILIIAGFLMVKFLV